MVLVEPGIARFGSTTRFRTRLVDEGGCVIGDPLENTPGGAPESGGKQTRRAGSLF